MRTQDEGVALLRDFHTMNVETELFRESHCLIITGLEYACDMGHGKRLDVHTTTYILRLNREFKLALNLSAPGARYIPRTP